MTPKTTIIDNTDLYNAKRRWQEGELADIVERFKRLNAEVSVDRDEFDRPKVLIVNSLTEVFK